MDQIKFEIIGQDKKPGSSLIMFSTIFYIILIIGIIFDWRSSNDLESLVGIIVLFLITTFLFCFGIYLTLKTRIIINKKGVSYFYNNRLKKSLPWNIITKIRFIARKNKYNQKIIYYLYIEENNKNCIQFDNSKVFNATDSDLLNIFKKLKKLKKKYGYEIVQEEISR
jgi:hypothetical protein